MAVDRKYLREMPKIVFARQLEKIPKVFSPEAEFVAIYQSAQTPFAPCCQLSTP